MSEDNDMDARIEALRKIQNGQGTQSELEDAGVMDTVAEMQRQGLVVNFGRPLVKEASVYMGSLPRNSPPPKYGITPKGQQYFQENT